MKRSLFAGAILLALGVLAFLWLREPVAPSELAVVEQAASEAPTAPQSLASTPPAPPLGDASARKATESEPEVTSKPEVAAPAVGVREIKVVVTDLELRPLEGARVEYFAKAGMRAYDTDAAGECRVQADQDDENVPLQVIAAGFLHQRLWTYRPEWGVKLRRTIALSGRVLDAETRVALPSARVSWIPDCCRVCKPLAVSADEAGAFRLEAVPFDQVTLRVEAVGSPMLQQQYELAAQGDSAEVELLVPRGVLLRGRIVDFTTGAGLSGATVTAYPAQKFVADERGAFEGQLVARTPGSMGLTVDAAGRCQLLASVTVDELSLGEPFELRVPDSPIVEGTLRDADGNPLAGANVAVRFDRIGEVRGAGSKAPGGESPLHAVSAAWKYRDSDASKVKTDASGAFRVVGLVPWDDHILVAMHDGFLTAQRKLGRLPGPGEHLALDVQLERERSDDAGWVSGRVYLNGLPVRASVGWQAAGRAGEATTTPYGYSTEKLPAGTVELHARVPGCPGPLEGDVASVELAAGKTVKHDFDLRTASTTIRGRVVFPSGAPAAGATAMIHVNNAQDGRAFWVTTPREARADEEGRFTLEVPACELELRVVATLGGASVQSDGLKPGAEGVQLVILGSGKLLFRAVDAKTGERIEPRLLKIYALTPEGLLLEELHVDTPRPDGAGWNSHELREGPIELMVLGNALGYKLQRASAVIVAKAETRVELQLEPALTTAFRLDPPPDERWSGHSVYVVEPGNWAGVRAWKDGTGHHFEAGPAFPYVSIHERQLQFDDQGLARLRCLGPGKYRLRILPDDIVLEPDSIELNGDTAEPIVVRWKR